MELIVFIVVIAMVAIAIARPTFFAKAKNRHLRHYQPGKDELLRQGFAAIKRSDPHFDFTLFAKQVAKTFVKVQKAWTAETEQSVSYLMSDGLLQRLRVMRELRKACGFRQVLESPRVMHVEAASIRRIGPFDVIQLRIEAQGTDYAVNLQNGEEIAGTRRSEKFAEYWSLLRRHSGNPPAGGGVLNGNCPSCGAALVLTDVGKCSYCQVTVGSGQHDWLVSEITQISAGDVRDREIPGLTHLHAKDPAFNVQFIEDRASVLFWHLRAAEVFGKTKLLDSLVHKQFDKRKLVQPTDPGGRRRFFANASIGAVEVEAIEVGPGGDSFDQIKVRVVWSGSAVEQPVPCFLPPNQFATQQYVDWYVLARRSGATSNAEQGLATFHCPSCGATESNANGGHCGYCALPLNEGLHNWVLADAALCQQ